MKLKTIFSLSFKLLGVRRQDTAAMLCKHCKPFQSEIILPNLYFSISIVTRDLPSIVRRILHSQFFDLPSNKNTKPNVYVSYKRILFRHFSKGVEREKKRNKIFN